MNKRKYFLPILIAIVVLVILISGAFVVNETQQVIITQFGAPVGKPITKPGIHFKIPLIQQAHFFERRFLEWDGAPNRVPTKDKKFIWVDVYGRWRISDPLLFFQRLRDERGAHSRLDDILDGETRTAIANHDLVEIVRSSNRKPAVDDEISATEQAEKFAEIKHGRAVISRAIIAAATQRTKDLGIEILDLRFKRINYEESVQAEIFKRMITERKRIADKFRSEGQGEASKILGDKERDLKEIQSNAYRQAQEINGSADARAAAIYAAAYNQSQEAREFYRFLKTMDTYKTTLSEKDWLILSTEGDFFKYLNKQAGK